MSRLIKIADWSGEKRGNVVFVHGLGGRGAELHLDFVRPVRHFPDRRFKRGDEAGEGAKRGLELVGWP